MEKERSGERMKLGAFFHPTGNHVAAWLHPDAKEDTQAKNEALDSWYGHFTKVCTAKWQKNRRSCSLQQTDFSCRGATLLKSLNL